MMIVASGLTYRAGGRAIVSNVDIEVPGGQLLALVGPNGAGKSTMLGLLAGDLTPNAGSVTMCGRPVRGARPRDLARLRAVMPQQSSIQFPFTAAEVVALGAYAGSASDPRAEVEDALQRVDAAHLATRRYTTLSGGEQARVTLARVLAQRTPLLLLDEPTAHLDLRHQSLLLRVARSLADEGHTVVAVLHDLNLAAQWADRVAVLAGGELVACGSPTNTLTASTLSTVYSHPITVIEHPLHGGPLALPTG
jgi:iron complex transport system ATP-binding protein